MDNRYKDLIFVGIQFFLFVCFIFDFSFLVPISKSFRIGLDLADTEILPMKIETYADVMEQAFTGDFFCVSSNFPLSYLCLLEICFY